MKKGKIIIIIIIWINIFQERDVISEKKCKKKIRIKKIKKKYINKKM